MIGHTHARTWFTWASRNAHPKNAAVVVVAVVAVVVGD